MLGLGEMNASDEPNHGDLASSGLEGLRLGCKSSLRNG